MSFPPTDTVVTVIGRGHSGTRAMSHTLTASGFFMGARLNGSGDLIPAEDLYEACRVFGKHVKHLGGMNWDFTAAQSMPIDPTFKRLVDGYLQSVLESDTALRGWKLPETTLILPWITRLFPDIHYVYWMRDPRDSILAGHLTDDLAEFGVPHAKTEDLRLMRATSWQYQFEIMKATPSPANRIDVRFEDFVLRQTDTLARLEAFLGTPMARIPVHPEAVGRWRSDPDAQGFDVFPRETLYEEPLRNPL